MNTALMFAKDVMRMQRELEDLREEVERLREVEQKYNELLNGALAHSREMAGQVLELCMSGGTFRPERANVQGNRTCAALCARSG
ncbi:hypothetical protein [Accumulibacter sp.]|uniref:hypothetical protein n=1 Tax=Accumulibacter sp. TaxID=2053492 RepID=UPI002626AE46|nr:hypothetical protein [Accumulibacter sp.]